jgi:hypothetical protein
MYKEFYVENERVYKLYIKTNQSRTAKSSGTPAKGVG